MSEFDGLQLSQIQSDVVNSEAEALLVLAGAGSGKTEVVACRIERLLREAPTEHFKVLALSYTVKAAQELEDRFRNRLGELARRVETNTIHGFAHSLLRQHGTRIGLPPEPEVLTRDEDRFELLAQWLSEQGKAVPSEPSSLFRALDLSRARLESAPFLDDWEQALRNSGAVDYPAMLTRASEVARLGATRNQLRRIYRHLVVDEAQNLTPAQFDFLESIIAVPQGDELAINSMLVGDDKQSIVGFAGADPQLMVSFEARFNALTFVLDRNYRSARAIVELGRNVASELGREPIDQPSEFAADGLITRKEAGGELAEARLIASWVESLLAEGLPSGAVANGESVVIQPNEIAVLGRSAAALRHVQAALEEVGIESATASAPEDWLTTVMGKVAFELFAYKSAPDHRSTQWELARLLGVADESLYSLSPTELSLVLTKHEHPGVQLLAAATEADTPEDFVHLLTDIEIPSDLSDNELASWNDDAELIQETWNAFTSRTEVDKRTWGNFRVFVTRHQRGDESAKGVRLLTIHKSQGREFKAVAIVAMNEGQFPDFRATTPEDRHAELRAFYVAVTRASRLLMLTRARSRETRYGNRSTVPSPFLRLTRAE